MKLSAEVTFDDRHCDFRLHYAAHAQGIAMRTRFVWMRCHEKANSYYWNCNHYYILQSCTFPIENVPFLNNYNYFSNWAPTITHHGDTVL